MIKYLGLFLGVAILQQCENPFAEKKYPIHLMNDSNHSIGTYLTLGGKHGSYYPDTVLPESSEYIISDIESNRTYYYDSGIKWEEIFSYDLPNDTMSIFIFHTDTLSKYAWGTIRNEYKILKRYDLSLEDLHALEFTVPYPPSPKMKNMKMFPPY